MAVAELGFALGGEAALPPDFPTRRGPLVFCRAAELAQAKPGDETVQWLGRFNVVFTNGYGLASPPVLAELQSRGTAVFLYFWTNGFVAAELERNLPDGRWRNELLARHPDWLLSPSPLEGPPGTPESYYFDFGQPELLDFLCEQLAAFRAQTGYDGYFFDYAGVYALPKAVVALWEQRHPGLPYDRAVLRFLERLREVSPEVLIFTNQAYRSTEPLLAAVDFDLMESAATSYAWGPTTEVDGEQRAETFFRPWEGPGGLREVHARIEARIAEGAPRRGFFYLDYALPRAAATGSPGSGPDLEAVYYSYAAAALWGRGSYCSGWHAGGEYRGQLYLADLGRPLDQAPAESEGLVWREYERGLVVLMTGTNSVQADIPLQPPGPKELLSLFDGECIPAHGGRARLGLEPGTYPLSRMRHPVGRVYLKVG